MASVLLKCTVAAPRSALIARWSAPPNSAIPDSSLHLVNIGSNPAKRARGLKIKSQVSLQTETATDAFEQTQERLNKLVEEAPGLKTVAAKKLHELTEELLEEEEAAKTELELDPFEKIKLGFLSFKQQQFLKKPEKFSKLAAGQSPKFMVVACADSRVCPSNTLGFQPGEAFIVRNVANLIPPWEQNGYPGTSAALEYAVLHLKVQHILVIGHSRCGGIKALMSTTDGGEKFSDFIENWIEIGKPARSRTKSIASNLPLEQQCAHCEKESVNQSLANLLTFPWIKDLVSQGKLGIHGGYYDFVEGTFERWELNLKPIAVEKLA